MKKSLLILALCLFAAPAWAATCPVSSVQVRDNTNTIANMSVVDDGSGLGHCLAEFVPAGGIPGHFLSSATNNSTSVKNSAGTLYQITVINTTATTVDLRLYDTSSAPTCSSSVGVIANYGVQGNSISPGMALVFPAGINFLNGIGICLTGAIADNDNTNAVTGIQVNWSFK